MTLPNVIDLLSRYEQLDMQKEQLNQQRNEQTARNIAQAVSTLMATPMEGRSGYLAMIQSELGLDTGFLSALAQSAPTPTAMLLNMGLQKAIDSGTTNPTDIAAYAVGATPMAFRQNAAVGKFLEDGTVPAFIKALPPEVQGTALAEMVTRAGGLPDLYELTNPDAVKGVRANVLPTGSAVLGEQGANSRQQAQLEQQAREAAANRGVQYAQLSQSASQFERELAQRQDQWLGGNATQLAIAGLNNDTRRATSRTLRGSGPGGALTAEEANTANMFANISDADLIKLESEQLARDTETQQSTGAGIKAKFGAGQTAANMNTTRTASSTLTRAITTERNRRTAEQAAFIQEQQRQPATQAVPQQQSFNIPQSPQIQPFAPVKFGQFLEQMRP